MAVTEPADLAFPGRNGNSEETAITNEAASRPGFPARKADGSLVFIVDQFQVGSVKVLIDEHGNQYRDDQPTGALVPVEEPTEETVSEEDVQPQLDEGVEPEAIEATASGEFVITEASGVEAAAADSTGGEAIELTQPEDLAESA